MGICGLKYETGRGGTTEGRASTAGPDDSPLGVPLWPTSNKEGEMVLMLHVDVVLVIL